MASGIITIGEVAHALTSRAETHLVISCSRCDRAGRLDVARLVLEYGRGMPVHAIGRIAAADCPRMIAGKIPDICGVRFPQLPELFIGPGAT